MPASELIARLRPALVPEAAGNARDAHLGPERHPGGGRSDQDCVGIPMDERLHPSRQQIADLRLGIHARQDRAEAAIAD
jgi:hypothetical protein